MLAEPTQAEHEILGAIPYQPNETVLHTDISLMPRRRRAWASWNFHMAEGAGTPPRDHRHLRHEQPSAARRARALPRLAEQDRGDRPLEGDHEDGQRPSRLHAGGHRRAGALARDRRTTGSTTAAPTGDGASTRTGSGARFAPASPSARPRSGREPARRQSPTNCPWQHDHRDRLRDLRGHSGAPAPHTDRPQALLQRLHGAARPGRAARAVRPPSPVVRAAPRPGALSRFRLPGGRRRPRARATPPSSQAAPAIWSPSAPAPRRRRDRSASSPPPAPSASGSTRSASTSSTTSPKAPRRR